MTERASLISAPEKRRELLNAARLLREAGARGSNGYPPSEQRVSEHEQAARAVEEAARG